MLAQWGDNPASPVLKLKSKLITHASITIAVHVSGNNQQCQYLHGCLWHCHHGMMHKQARTHNRRQIEQQ